jgi:cytochrome c-type biogenesis protein CcmH/NrfF
MGACIWWQAPVARSHRFRKQYGEKILSAPTTQGFNLLAWTMPFIALLAGGGIIVLVMDRWRTRRNVQ